MIHCEVDEFVPIPTRTEVPSGVEYQRVRERAQAACRAAEVLLRQGYTDTTKDIGAARSAAAGILNAVAQGSNVPSSIAGAVTSTPESAAYVDAVLRTYDMQVVGEAKRLRNFVTNKLILEAENNDPRVRLRALELLGKISDVGLFSERTEVTVTNRSTSELEQVLRAKLDRLLNKEAATDAVILPAVPRIDVPRPAQELEGL